MSLLQQARGAIGFDDGAAGMAVKTPLCWALAPCGRPAVPIDAEEEGASEWQQG